MVSKKLKALALQALLIASFILIASNVFAQFSCPLSCGVPQGITTEQINEIQGSEAEDLCKRAIKSIPPQFCSEFKARIGSTNLRTCATYGAAFLSGYADQLEQYENHPLAGLAGINVAELKVVLETLIERLRTETKAIVDLSCSETDQSLNDCSIEFCNDTEICEQTGFTEAEPFCQSSLNCGNNVLDAGEECEAEQLNGASCEEFGLGGEVSCNQCKLDFSGCFSEDQGGKDEAFGGTPIECESEDNLIGLTGTAKMPRVDYTYQWGPNKCIVEEIYPNGLVVPNNNYVYCDSSQALMSIMARINKLYIDFLSGELEIDTTNGLSNESTIIVPFKVKMALMPISFTDDFRKDFDYFHKNIPFFETPSYYENFSEHVTNSSLLRFSPTKITEPGIYLMETTIDIDFGNPRNSVITLNFTKEADPEPDSTLYYFPLESSIGLNKRPDEPEASRVGYGKGFVNGEEFEVNNIEHLATINSTEGNIAVTTNKSFEGTNLANRGKLLQLNLNQETLLLTPSLPNAALVEQGGGQDPLFLILTQTGIFHTANYSNWVLMQSTQSCEEIEIFEMGIPDVEIEAPLCQNNPIGYAHGFEAGIPSLRGETNFLGTIFYTPTTEYSLKGECQTSFSTSNQQNVERVLFAGTDSINLQNLLLETKKQNTCLYDDPNSKSIQFFWNKKKFLSQLPACQNCACNNQNFAPELVSAYTSSSELYQGESVTFFAEVQSYGVTNIELKLFLAKPGEQETLQDLIFYDDGQHNDYLPSDNIFAATVVDGYQQEGTYNYRIVLTDAAGNTSEKTGSFNVLEVGKCTFIQGPTDNKMFYLNVFIMGQGYRHNEELFNTVVEQQIENLLSSEELQPYRDIFNFYSIPAPTSLECDFENAIQVNEDLFAVECNEEKVIGAAIACNTPLQNHDALMVVFEDTPYIVANTNPYLLTLLMGDGEGPSEIITVWTSFEQINIGDPLTFFASTTQGTPFSNENMQLFINPPNRDEHSSSLVFFDDGLHLDGFAGDGVFAATQETGFEVVGEYNYRITLTDDLDNTSEKTGSFSVIERGECSFVDGPGENQLFYVNVFLLGQGYEGREDQFSSVVDTIIASLLNNPLLGFYRNFLNFYSIPTATDLQCDFATAWSSEIISQTVSCNQDLAREAIGQCSTNLQNKDVAIVVNNDTPYIIDGFQGILGEV